MTSRAKNLAGYTAISALLLTVALVSWPSSQNALEDAPSSNPPAALGSVDMDYTSKTQASATVSFLALPTDFVKVGIFLLIYFSPACSW